MNAGVLTRASGVAILGPIQQTTLFLYLVALGTTISGMEACTTVLLVLLLWQKIAEPRGLSWKRPPLLLPLLGFVVVMALGIYLGSASASEKIYDLKRIRFFALYGVLYWTLLQAIPRFKWDRVLVLLGIFMGVYGTVQHFVPIDLFRPVGKKVILYAIQDEQIGPLVIGTFNHHLTFAGVYLFYASVLTAIGVYSRRTLHLVLGLWMFALVLFTQSRTAWVAVPITLMIVLLWRGRQFVLGALFGCAVLLFSLYASDPGFRERMLRTLSTDQETYSVNPRLRLWSAQIAMFKDHPLLGVGWNNSERRAKEYVDRLYPDVPQPFYGHAHSNFLQILGSTGILGMCFYLWMWGTVFYFAWRLIQVLPRGSMEWSTAVGLFAAFAGFQIQGLTQWSFGDAEVLHNVIFFWALISALWTKNYISPASRARYN